MVLRELALRACAAPLFQSRLQLPLDNVATAIDAQYNLLLCKDYYFLKGRPQMSEILTAYLITAGWALVGSISVGLGIIIALKMFTISTRNVDEWDLIKEGNIPMAIILASVVLSLGLVISAAIQP